MNRFSAFIQALLFPLLPLLCNSLALGPHVHPHQQERLDIHPRIAVLRPASELDLDDMTTVVLDAFAPSQLYQYIFPQFDQLKEYHWRCMRKEFGQQFAKIRKAGFLNVISVPTSHGSVNTQAGRRNRVVAVAAWIFVEPHAASNKYGDIGLPDIHSSIARCSEHLDMNMTRALDYARQSSLAEKHFVIDYPNKQMYLALLATHPDWDGHGFGAMHCHWGMEKAKAMNIPNTLFATPAGWPLYDSLGFESVANITFTTLDWPVNLWDEYMQYRS